MFYECCSLRVLPDISKWDTSQVTNMSNMFAKCSSLSNKPDISQSNMSNVNNISNMFKECQLLQSIPNIYNLNNNKTINIEEDSLETISIEITKKIIEQLENNIYEINIGNNNKYMGIFCKISYFDNFMNILIINKAINTDKIKVLINNKYKEIKIERRRKYIKQILVYTSNLKYI